MRSIVRVPVLLVAATAMLASLAGQVPASGTEAVGDAAPAGVEDWSQFHHDPALSGLSGETAISSAKASTLRQVWQVNTGGQAFTSPAVVYNATLGKSVAYVGNQNGYINAYDAATGARIWSYKVRANVVSSPAVVGGTVYIGASDKNLYALNATTGTLRCKAYTGGVMVSSPLVVDPDGRGPVAYIGDNGLNGSDDGGHLWAVDGNTCAIRWGFDGYGATPGSEKTAGTWSPPAFGRTAAGVPLVVFGGSSPDNSAYAVDARTGARVWRFRTLATARDEDVGAGAAISAPGVNGFADGVAYIHGKDRRIYALNLRTGTKIWTFSYRPSIGGGRSTPALVGDRLYVGYGAGVYALDARTGARVWRSQDVGPAMSEVITSPAVTGPAGDRVLFVGDMAGKFSALDLATGQLRWSTPLGGFIYSSAAVSAGRVYVAGSNGFLNAFSTGGGGGGQTGAPEATISSPASGATVPNPGGPLTISGRATDDAGVSSVLVAVKNNNLWYDAATGKWVSAFTENRATLASPGAASTAWSFSLPMKREGGNYFVQVDATDSTGQHDPTLTTSTFFVTSLGNPPETTVTSPKSRSVIAFPNGRRPFPITVTGTATDSAGATPGVSKVAVAVLNLEHTEYWCGPSGCPVAGGARVPWLPGFRTVPATLAAPNATNTTWSLTFMTYDHEHSYRIIAFATDRDGEVDQTRAVVGPVCVRDPGNNACG